MQHCSHSMGVSWGSPGGLEMQKLELVEWLHSSFDQGNVNHG